jgi:hypothetical protein
MANIETSIGICNTLAVSSLLYGSKKMDNKYKKHQVRFHGDEYEYGCLLMMEAVSSSETSVSIYQTTQGNIPEDSHLQIIINRR